MALIELLADDLLAGLRGQANALVLQTDLLGECLPSVSFEGSLTHAYALVSDLITIRGGYRTMMSTMSRLNVR